MWLLIFHLFLSSFTHDGVDVMMAQKIVDWNLKRYPEGKLNASLSRLVTGRRLSLILPRRFLPARPGAAQLDSKSAQTRN